DRRRAAPAAPPADRVRLRPLPRGAGRRGRADRGRQGGQAQGGHALLLDAASHHAGGLMLSERDTQYLVELGQAYSIYRQGAITLLVLEAYELPPGYQPAA